MSTLFNSTSIALFFFISLCFRPSDVLHFDKGNARACYADVLSVAEEDSTKKKVKTGADSLKNGIDPKTQLGSANKDMDDTIFPEPVEIPSYPAGEKAFAQYLKDNIRYPDSARNAKIQGKVYLQFVIMEDGSVANVTVARGIGYGCDEEAVRVLRASPKWNPAKCQGKPIKIRMAVPVQFKLD